MSLDELQEKYNKRMRKLKKRADNMERTIYIPPRSDGLTSNSFDFNHHGIQSQRPKYRTNKIVFNK